MGRPRRLQPSQEALREAFVTRGIRFECRFRNTILEALETRPGWASTDGTPLAWDFMWCGVEWVRQCFDETHFQPHQRLNHFRNHYELTRKDHLEKNIKRTAKALRRAGSSFADDYDFTPPTFTLPMEYALLSEEFRRPDAAGATWIMKPVGKAQGKGIFLFQKLSQISDWRRDSKWAQPAPAGPPAYQLGRGPATPATPPETYVAQRYIANPYLIGQKKFDLRLYCLVTSYSPLTVWLSREGFARFSFQRYDLTKGNISDTAVHLTNVAVQKLADDYDGGGAGCKWSLAQVRQYVESRHGPDATAGLFNRIERMIVRSLQAVAPVIIADNHCFELYGYDVLFDADLKPWLIEVNASPSLTADTEEDRQLKVAMLSDMLSVLDLEGAGPPVPDLSPRSADASPTPTAPTETQVGGFDLVFRQNSEDRSGTRDLDAGWVTTCSRLGCFNDRARQLRLLDRQRRRGWEVATGAPRPLPSREVLAAAASAPSLMAPPADAAR
jgi:tubulin polyglutamylase TTLL9